MTALTERLAQTGLQLPELITGYQDGADLPADEGATALPLYYPGTGEQIARLQEDDASRIAGAISAATARFHAGDWSRAPVSERQRVFRSAARAIRTCVPRRLRCSVGWPRHRQTPCPLPVRIYHIAAHSQLFSLQLYSCTVYDLQTAV